MRTMVLNNHAKHPAVEFGLEQRKAILSPGDISDWEIFVELAAAILPIGIKPPSTADRYLRYAIYGAVILLGLNGWVGSYVPNASVEPASLFSGIVLAVWVVAWPFYILVGRSNAKRMARHRD